MPTPESPSIIFVTGLPGSGKSYFAARFATQANCLYLNSDRIRKELFPVRTYSSEEKIAVYDKMKEILGEWLQKGKSGILDATFYKARLRNEFMEWVENAGGNYFWIEIRANEETIRQRVNKPREYSEADFEVYKKIKASAEPLEIPHLELWSDDENVERMITEARNYTGL